MKIKIPILLPDIFTINEIEKFFSVIQEDDAISLRNKCIFELMYSSCLKIYEVINLKIDDINLDEHYVQLKNRRNPIGDESEKLLNKYLKRYRFEFEDSDYLFPSHKKGILNRRSIWRIFKVITKQIKLKQNATTNIFRHSFAVHFFQNGADLKSVQELLGIQNINKIKPLLKFVKGKNK